MARQARGESLDPGTIQIVHATQRCVRRAFLCGQDPLSGRSLEHRRQWIRDRLEMLASVFAIDCLTFAVMSNHLHVILRSRPDVVRTWSDEEVARRWLRLFPRRRRPDGQPARPTASELSMITADPRRLAELRVRLSDISWWMRCTAENIARRANREDDCTGRFWEGRYRAQLILDEPSLLACTMYVDLNPVRAALAETPEQSTYTGACERIADHRQAAGARPNAGRKRPGRSAGRRRQRERNRHSGLSGWLSPLELDERRDPAGPDPARGRRRASCKGFLAMSLERYLQLLDWTGRQLQSGKPGRIPDHLSPILERLGIESRQWCRVVRQFGQLFKRAAGTPESLSREAERRRQHRMNGPGAHLLVAA